MQLNQVSTAGPTLGTQASSQSSTPVLGQDDFLKLLVSQLQNQDPMNPLDSTQLASQLAQFSSVQELANLNTAVQNQTNANLVLTQSISNTMAATLIGKKVKANTSNIGYDGSTAQTLGFNLPNSAADVQIKISDSNGTVIRTIDAGPKPNGDSTIQWDGKDDAGNAVSAGNYTFSVTATDSQGKAIASTLFVLGIVQGVRYNSTGATLLVNGAEINFSDVQEILGN
ncbi:MAG: flagellar hook capping protein [Bacteroidetes bacterium]|nr:flagellar hook capping protein [Bacteroidota bacterium]MCL5738242.1 flagellar hook capping protein [Bacteroidota bacterium]